MIRIDPTSGASTAVLTAPADSLIADAQWSPDGRSLACLDGRCDRSYLNQFIRVRDLTTGGSWTIGAHVMPCHSLGSLSWTNDGRHLATEYGPSTVTPANARPEYGAGTCRDPAAATPPSSPRCRRSPASKDPQRAPGPLRDRGSHGHQDRLRSD